MQVTLKKGSLLLSVFAALLVTMALAASSASAVGFCGGSTVNNANKCWGAPRAMSGATAHGNLTGVCVGADTYSGTCAPTNQNASVSVPYGTHYPWILGTAGNFTYAWGDSTP
jgi:hypothetical protein